MNIDRFVDFKIGDDVYGADLYDFGVLYWGKVTSIDKNDKGQKVLSTLRKNGNGPGRDYIGKHYPEYDSLLNKRSEAFACVRTCLEEMIERLAEQEANNIED